MQKVISILVSTLLSFNISIALGKEVTLKPKVIENAKKAVVTIHTNVSLKAYGYINASQEGTGCVVDKAQGIVLTNRHVVDHAAIGTYQLTFHNGEQADAKLCYYDPWLDYAFLKVAPQEIPEDATAVVFGEATPKMNQPIFITGNNEGRSFSVHTGNVSSLHEVIGSMPQHSINVSLNTKGGSSGSPILDTQGKAVALNYAASGTFGMGLHPAYIQYALSFIQQGKLPVRRHIGVIIATYSLNDAVKHRQFPQESVKSYGKKFPTARGNALEVVRVLQDSPAHGKLLAGDIIWAVDGQEVGPDLITLDRAMNSAASSSVHITVYRNGAWLEIDVPLYDLEAHKLQRMVSFGGALFFETDDTFSEKLGIPAGTLTFSNAQASTTFGQVEHYGGGGVMYFGLKLLALDGIAIHNLEELIRCIPRLIAKRYFTIDYLNLVPNDDKFSPLFEQRFSQQDVCKADVAYDLLSPEPMLFTFNQAKMQWERERIVKQ